MNRYKNITLKGFITDFLPNSRDNILRLFTKIIYLLCIIGILCSSIYIVAYYRHSLKQQEIIETDRDIFANKNAEIMVNRNNDYKAWISIEGTRLNNPVFKTDNNSFYLEHNSLKEKSRYGSLFLDYRCDFSRTNAVIYGKSADDGLMFSTLGRLRELKFYREHSVINLNLDGENTPYKIYAVFVLNSSKSQDNGKIYNIYKTEFADAEELDVWVSDAKKRSIVNTGVNVKTGDKIITLVTECDDFKGARLVVMARSQRDWEKFSVSNNDATLNSNTRYPKKWYDDRNIKYPFENFKDKE